MSSLMSNLSFVGDKVGYRLDKLGLSKYIDNLIGFVYNFIRTCVRTAKGEKCMTENQKELIELIRENDSPKQALMAAALVIIGFLKQHESSVGQASVGLQVHG